MKRIAICAGGDSPEWEVSMKGARQFMEWLDKNLFEPVIVHIKGTDWKAITQSGNEYPVDKNNFSFTVDKTNYTFDYALINIHGRPGENGVLQSYLELLNIPYNTCGVLSSALTFNKYACKTFLSAFCIKSAKGILVRRHDTINEDEIVRQLGLPCFIKPNNSGSSFGVSKVKEKKDIRQAIENALKEDDEVLVEEFLKGTEITNGVARIDGKKVSMPITEIVSKNEFFDYEAKYTSGISEEITPARISRELEAKCKAISSTIYDLLDCRGIVRIDYIIKNDELFMLEVNTTPGMSPSSIIPQQIKAMGSTVTEVYSKIILSTFRH